MIFEILFRIRLIWGFQGILPSMITPRKFVEVFCFISRLSSVTVGFYHMLEEYKLCYFLYKGKAYLRQTHLVTKFHLLNNSFK